jgi:hypothetical protein
MTEYYRVYNITKERGNIYGLHPYYHLFWIRDIQSYNTEEKINLFDHIIVKNNWNEQDFIVAFGDNGTKFRYKCSTVDEYNPTQEELNRELEIEDYFEKLDMKKLIRSAFI